MTEKISDYKIRRAENADIAAIGELLYQVHGVHAAIRPDIFIEGRRKYDDAKLAEILKDDDAPVFVLTADGIVAGYIFLRIQRGLQPSHRPITTLYIDDLCVGEKVRGQGIGHKLFAFAEKFAKDIGAYNITLHVYEGNDRAKLFYENLGMKKQYTAMEKIISDS